ncbi:MAG: phage tail protein [Deltaproteobacteria bacterium]|nr:phage tail protein [Deltaproteobacteria bacterium]
MRIDPLSSFNFLVEIEGVTSAGFQEVNLSDNENDITEYREGNEDITVRKLPGLKKFSNVTLKRGLTTDKALWDWRKKVMDGQVERQNVSIILLDENRNERVRWNIINAWPSKWTGPELKAPASEIAIETLELCHEGYNEQEDMVVS